MGKVLLCRCDKGKLMFFCRKQFGYLSVCVWLVKILCIKILFFAHFWETGSLGIKILPENYAFC